MPFESTKPKLVIPVETLNKLVIISNSRTEPIRRVERARIIIAFNSGISISEIARQLKLNRVKVNDCLNKALQLGPEAALDDLPGRGKPKTITEESRVWILSLACQKPKDLGYSYELWTTRLLAEHIQKTCVDNGHPCLAKISRGTVSKILTKSKVRPHKIEYYLERRDPNFEAKMAQVLCVYNEVALLRNVKSDEPLMKVILSYDEKPGIQAIENIAPDLPPVPGEHPCIGRDYEYKRHGTVSLLAGIDLLSGKIYGLVEDRHRSCEFVNFLKLIDKQYPEEIKIKIILDNHSAHVSKETRKYLTTVPNRFEFVFTPTHGSWLNLIESFFGKMAKTMLRGIRVASKIELKQRIEKYLDEINELPVIFKWKYGVASNAITQHTL
jgi:transposase